MINVGNLVRFKKKEWVTDRVYHNVIGLVLKTHYYGLRPYATVFWNRKNINNTNEKIEDLELINEGR